MEAGITETLFRHTYFSDLISYFSPSLFDVFQVFSNLSAFLLIASHQVFMWLHLWTPSHIYSHYPSLWESLWPTYKNVNPFLFSLTALLFSLSFSSHLTYYILCLFILFSVYFLHDKLEWENDLAIIPFPIFAMWEQLLWAVHILTYLCLVYNEQKLLIIYIFLYWYIKLFQGIT